MSYIILVEKKNGCTPWDSLHGTYEMLEDAYNEATAYYNGLTKKEQNERTVKVHYKEDDDNLEEMWKM